jgi:hypothetical protein
MYTWSRLAELLAIIRWLGLTRSTKKGNHMLTHILTRTLFGKNSLKTLAGALLCSAGLISAQAPSAYFNMESQSPGNGGTFQTFQYDLDFSKSSSVYPSRNFPTWTAPNGQSVKYVSLSPKGATGCFEISSTLPNNLSGDPILYVKNEAGNWVAFADDNAGYSQFKARIFMQPHEDASLRVSPYYNSGNNIVIFLTVKSIKGIAGAATDAVNCRLAGVPYREQNLNGGNPM